MTSGIGLLQEIPSLVEHGRSLIGTAKRIVGMSKPHVTGTIKYYVRGDLALPKTEGHESELDFSYLSISHLNDDPQTLIRYLIGYGTSIHARPADDSVRFVDFLSDCIPSVSTFLDQNLNSRPMLSLFLGTSLTHMARFRLSGAFGECNVKNAQIVQNELMNQIDRIRSAVSRSEFSYDAVNAMDITDVQFGRKRIDALVTKLIHNVYAMEYRFDSSVKRTIDIDRAMATQINDVALYAIMAYLYQTAAGTDEFAIAKADGLIKAYEPRLDLLANSADEWIGRLATLYNTQLSQDLDLRVMVASVFQGIAGLAIRKAAMSSGLSRRWYLNRAGRYLMISQEYRMAVQPSWVHGLAGMYTFGYVLAALKGQTSKADSYYHWARRYYIASGDIYRLHLLESFETMRSNLTSEELFSNISSVLFHD